MLKIKNIKRDNDNKEHGVQKLSDLMQKEMTRKEFLATLGFGVATALGFSTLIRLVTGKDNNPFKQSSMGYGSGAYGGNKKA